jgi:hypothetical protein
MLIKGVTWNSFTNEVVEYYATLILNEDYNYSRNPETD